MVTTPAKRKRIDPDSEMSARFQLTGEMTAAEKARERKRQERQRYRDKGQIKIEIWTYPECRDAIRRCAEKVTRQARCIVD